VRSVLGSVVRSVARTARYRWGKGRYAIHDLASMQMVSNVFVIGISACNIEGDDLEYDDYKGNNYKGDVFGCFSNITT
jgi:hypothetical protein